MKHATTRALYDYWDRLRAGRAAPARSDLHPGSIRALLADVFLLERDELGVHRVRLAGTRICTLLGREWRGQRFTELFAARDRADMAALVDGVAGDAVPIVAGIAAGTADGRFLDLELLILPLRHHGRTDTRLLGSLVAGEWPYWAGTCPLASFRLVSTRHIDNAVRDGIDLAGAPIRAMPGSLRVLPGGRR
jgi:hypothetical protein